MNKLIMIPTIVVALASHALAADVQKQAIAKSEANAGNAVASASSTTTNLNGRPVTIVEDQDDNGRKRLRMITYRNGKPKVKDITPVDKKVVNKEDPFSKKQPAGNLP